MLNKKALAASVSAGPSEYVEDVASIYLYTGNGSTQTITNNVDLSGEGGLVWIKSRSAATDHQLFDTERGATKELISNSTAAEATDSDTLTAFNADGFSLGADSNTNTNAATYASFTFRKAKKFFDVVTYTGNGGDQTINHNLGSTPGMVIIKRLNSTSDWVVWHRSLSLANTAQGLKLNDTAAFGNQSGNSVWGSTSPMTSTTFSVGASGAGDWNTNLFGATYVAYLFAHDAGGFGAAGTDNIISCGSFTTNSSGKTASPVSLGYEPQFVMIKSTAATPTGGDNWFIYDTMRGFPIASGISKVLIANGSAAEADAESALSRLNITNTGFEAFDVDDNQTYIYMAIRRPMKTPTSGTSVFGDISASAEPVSTNLTTESGVLADLVVHGLRTNGGNFGAHWASRLTGNGRYLVSSNTNAEAVNSNFWKFDNNNFAYIVPSGYANNTDTDTPYFAYSFKRATGFFDVVCYTGTGANRTITHNLGAVPELMIVKPRDSIGTSWTCYSSALANTEYIFLNTTGAKSTGATRWNSTTPTSSVFSVGTSTTTNDSGVNFVAYLFATVAGVSKVGSYTGTGSTQTINCGFTAGARLVLIKRTDDVGDWYVWDAARGIVSGNDPYWLLNSTAVQVTNTDYIDPANSGFEISSTAPAAINANGGSFIFLAIA